MHIYTPLYFLGIWDPLVRMEFHYILIMKKRKVIEIVIKHGHDATWIRIDTALIYVDTHVYFLSKARSKCIMLVFHVHAETNAGNAHAQVCMRASWRRPGV